MIDALVPFSSGTLSISPRKLPALIVFTQEKGRARWAAGMYYSEAVPLARSQSGSSIVNFGALALPREEYFYSTPGFIF